ncbi:hypothetical protein GR927_30270 [Mycolicibacterium sp. 3033]|nr:hypothetical protein [Mycolicibacterium aurantiacum]
MTEPEYVRLGLPADTITARCAEAHLVLTGDGDGKIVTQLVVHADDMGWYRLVLTPATYRSLLAQAAGLSGMSKDQTHELARRLNGGDESE